MKILAVSDLESSALWEHFDRRRLEGVDLILSCGDLSPRYLSFLTTFTAAPVIYVHGNHDDCYEVEPPEGCICIENHIFTHQGVRIFGLGGSMRYKREGAHQYTQRQMCLRVLRCGLTLRRWDGFDILLTHAPARGVNDGTDLAHSGFGAFNTLLDRYRPRYFVHGHVHMNYGLRHPRCSVYGATQVINAYESYVFDY
ncbi:metallophosphoesterase [Pseudoflavonifractor sp. 524-17]|uniref:metallophosphoesterase family protein n=1 Tax=Pseudoflavonifractor sp. 524-17 TaxID=2304577 RepID=UPI00137A43F5|nr:metallophosphoesterase [Pseudoflavonifractor sp. 524-17]NCE65755.1 metallophosphoesterase [Pseudoflavonifractor sp. 524-17]